MRRIFFSVALLSSVLFTPTPLSASPKTKVWWYASVYKEYATPIERAFEAKFPQYDLVVFQAGSEKLLTKIEAELRAKRPQVDVISVSDPFYVTDLNNRNLLLKREKTEPVRTNYYSAMVLITNKSFPAEKRPKTFADLANPTLNNMIQMGSPLESGSQFSFVAYMQKKLGWSFFEKLRDNKISAYGGNATVIQKVESGEKKIGVVLLENALASIQRGSPIEVIYPTDGAFSIPSYQGIFASTKNKEGSAAFADFLLTKEAQTILTSGFMFSADKTTPLPPPSKKALAETIQGSPDWDAKFITDVAKESKDIKKKFARLILE